MVKPSKGGPANRALLAGALGFGAFAFTSVARGTDAPKPDWAFNLTPYIWVPGVQVETSLLGTPPSTTPETRRFETRTAGAAMLAADIRYKSVGLFADFLWLRLNTEADNPGPAFSEVNLQSDLIHGPLAFGYRLPLRGGFHADAQAGARLWQVTEDIEAKDGALPGFASNGDKTWVDPLAGATLQYDLGAHWSLTAKGTAGGFGAAADLDWEALGAANYQCSEPFSVSLGYRYLHEDYARDQFNLRADIQGVILGLGSHL